MRKVFQARRWNKFECGEGRKKRNSERRKRKKNFGAEAERTKNYQVR
jgi:hypothetical protein